MTFAPYPALPGDSILGVAPERVYWPETVADCAAVLAHEQGRIGFIGGGTELGLGRPPAWLTAVVRTGRMARILDYAPADMVVVAEAGVTVAQLQAVAAAERQMLALDPPLAERATLGGLVATSGFGPRRARYGAIRDLIIGVALVRADGILARGGGKVVKNVAGFDLPKVMCGSLGTLGLVVETTFRLHPLPEMGATVLFGELSADQVVAVIAALRQRQLEPTSAVALRGAASYDLGVRFEGFDRGVKQQVLRAVELGGELKVTGEALADDRAFWQRHDRARTDGALRVKLTALPAQLPALESSVTGLLGALRDPSFAWYATLGIGFAGGEPRDAGAAIELDATRAALIKHGGALVIEAAPADLRTIDPWGPPPAAFALMAALKQRFDPERRLNPGRFVGGL
jgi:glycolate oxidase FAD binding subunit